MAKGLKAFKNGKRYRDNLQSIFDNRFFTEAKKDIGGFVVSDIVRTSRTHQDPSGKYQHYSKAYDKRKAKKFPGRGYMQATGESLGTPSNPKHFKVVYGRGSVTIIYDGPKHMVYHQKGTGPQPVRKWFGVGRKSTREGVFGTLKKALKATVRAVNSGKRL